MGHLYFGDNLEVLRNSVPDESVDLIYLDPPFNSKRDYNLLFKTPKGHNSDASITVFEDSWHWGPQAECSYDDIMHQPNTNVAEMIEALRRFLGTNDMMAYLAMMCSRLLELHRVLKPTGSLFLHCDPTASHYLKVVLDGVFGATNFRNEISWRRSQPKSHTSINFPNCRDVILRYAKSPAAKFNKVYGEHSPEYLTAFYKHQDDKGIYRLGDLTNPNKNRPNLTYEFLGVTRVWRWTRERMQNAYDQGLVYQSKTGAVPQIKRYLEDMKGQPICDDWDDIEHLHGSNTEALGYPTQKPMALLERIITSSTDEGDMILDPFCGCGTAIHAAEKLSRQWTGIDITHLAISVIEERLRKHFPGIVFDTHGTPKDPEGARDLAKRDKYEFQWWVCHLLGAQPYQNKKKGADGGVDGILYFKDVGQHHKKIILSVKGGENVNVAMVRDLAHVVTREKAEIGLFISLAEPTRPMIEEALKAGFYTPPFLGTKFRKIQIITIDGLLKGTERPEYPSLNHGGIPLKKIKGQASKQLPLLLPYEGKKTEEAAIPEDGSANIAPPRKRRGNQLYAGADHAEW